MNIKRKLLFFGNLGNKIVDGLDIDYRSIIDVAISKKYSFPNIKQQIIQNQLMIDLKSNNVLSLEKIFYVLANNGGSDFAKLNWVDPNKFELVNQDSDEYVINKGFKINGLQYFKTGFIPSENNVLGGFSSSLFMTDFKRSNTVYFGCGIENHTSETSPKLAFYFNVHYYLTKYAFSYNWWYNFSNNWETPTGFWQLSSKDLEVPINNLIQDSDNQSLNGVSWKNELEISQELYFMAYNNNGVPNGLSPANTTKIGIFSLGNYNRSVQSIKNILINQYMVDIVS